MINITVHFITKAENYVFTSRIIPQDLTHAENTTEKFGWSKCAEQRDKAGGERNGGAEDGREEKSYGDQQLMVDQVQNWAHK